MARRKKETGVVKIIFKVLCILLIVGVNGIILWRVFSSGDPSSVKTLMVNQKTYDAYKHSGDSLTMWYQEQNNITKGQDNYGYFAVTDWYYIDQAEQLQLTFRYNNSTIRHLAEDYGLDKAPDRGEDLYDVSLLIAYDLTPEDTTDNDTNDPESVTFVRYFPSDSFKTQKNLYNYRKYVFDDIQINDLVLAVYVDFYYVEDIDYENEAYGTLILYDYATKARTRALSSNDVKALKKFVGE